MIGTQTLAVPVQAYPFPSATVETNNYGLTALVFVWGGTVTAIKVQGVTGSVTNGLIVVPPGNTFEVDYTVAPFWTVFLLA